jgi:hypothetical protein
MRVKGGSSVQQDESVATSGDKWQRFWDGKQGKFPCRSSIIELKFGLMDSGGLARGRIIYWLSSEVEQNFVDFLPKVALILARFQLFSLRDSCRKPTLTVINSKPCEVCALPRPAPITTINCY